MSIINWGLDKHAPRKALYRYFVDYESGNAAAFQFLNIPLKILITSISGSKIHDSWKDLIIDKNFTSEEIAEDLVIKTIMSLQKSGFTSAFIARSIAALICSIEKYHARIIQYENFDCEQKLILDFTRHLISGVIYPVTERTIDFVVKFYEEERLEGDFEQSLILANNGSLYHRSVIFNNLCEIWNDAVDYYVDSVNDFGPIFKWVDDGSEYMDVLLKKYKILYSLGRAGDDDESIKCIVHMGFKGHYESWMLINYWAQNENERDHIIKILLNECSLYFTKSPIVNISNEDFE